MKQNEVDFILTHAYAKGVVIVFAARPSDLEQEGVHVYQPTMEMIIDAVADAVKHGFRTVMIHEERKTWPFPFRY